MNQKWEKIVYSAVGSHFKSKKKNWDFTLHRICTVRGSNKQSLSATKPGHKLFFFSIWITNDQYVVYFEAYKLNDES